MPALLITTYLEMTAPGQFRPAYVSDPEVLILRCAIPHLAFYRFLYQAVGEKWRWRDRLLWSDAELSAWLERPTTTVDVLYVQGTPAGYIELDRGPEATEIAYFGLMEPFLGRGYGKHLLSFGIQQAWAGGAKRVWVHTCNLDGPHALQNYQRRGFQIYDVIQTPLPERYVD